MSISACLDLLSTLLHLGNFGWVNLLKQRQMVYDYFKVKLLSLADKHSLQLLETPDNDVSFGWILISDWRNSFLCIFCAGGSHCYSLINRFFSGLSTVITTVFTLFVYSFVTGLSERWQEHCWYQRDWFHAVSSSLFRFSVG